MSTCRICTSLLTDRPVVAREMMFGSRQPFEYQLCGACGSLQIAQIPADIGSLYSPNDYYSFGNARPRQRWKRLARRWTASWMLGRPERAPTGGGRFADLKRATEPWIATVPDLKRDDLILDVGTGKGAQLEDLAALGFTRLAGIDPFLPPEQAGRTPSGIELIRGDLASVTGRYDLITLHHSLEHVTQPGQLLEQARGRLTAGGRVLVRIPLLQPWVWERYGVNWAQLDPPRHLHLFTTRAFINLAERAGFRCTSYGFDGMGWSIAWSEAYARGIPMNEPDGRANALPFDAKRMKAFEAEARAHNAAGEGDAGWFVLSPAEA